MKTVKLGGALGKKFGREYRLNVKTGAEAIKALAVQLPGMKEYLIKSGDQGLEFAVFYGDRNINPTDELANPAGSDVIRVMPVPAGSKRGGLFQTILGVALVAAAFMIPAGAAATTLFSVGGSAVTVGQALFTVGATLALGGFSQMLSPQPSLDIGVGTDEAANRSFNGPVNTLVQGDCVPLALGRVLIGSAVISGSIHTEEGTELRQGVDASGRPGWVFASPQAT